MNRLEWLQNSTAPCAPRIMLLLASALVSLAGCGGDKPTAPAQSPAQFVLAWGTSGSALGQFLDPRGIAVDRAGNVYVADTGNDRVQVFSGTGRFIRSWGGTGTGPGEFQSPIGIAADSVGNIFVIENGGSGRVQKFTAGGAFLTSWFTGINMATTLAADAAGNVYATNLDARQVLRFSADGTPTATWGSRGNANGQFEWPWSVATDRQGNVYVTDQDNTRVQKFTSDGGFLAVWGSAGSGSGQFGEVSGVATSPDGARVYVTDEARGCVHAFTNSGIFLSRWGRRGTGTDEFGLPWAVAVDEGGSVYVVDRGRSRVAKFSVR